MFKCQVWRRPFPDALTEFSVAEYYLVLWQAIDYLADIWSGIKQCTSHNAWPHLHIIISGYIYETNCIFYILNQTCMYIFPIVKDIYKYICLYKYPCIHIDMSFSMGEMCTEFDYGEVRSTDEINTWEEPTGWWSIAKELCGHCASLFSIHFISANHWELQWCQWNDDWQQRA